MKCIVSAGPTYEPLDQVRRLTNFSTGRLGCELAGYLTARGHEVTLLLGHYATWRGPVQAAETVVFTTTSDLEELFRNRASSEPYGIFHAAAVSDFGFGKTFLRGEDGGLTEICAGKIPTRHGQLLAELVPTPKIIIQLRNWFPRSFIVGWKYEVDGESNDVLEKGRRQLRECRTNACVLNGPAYGKGFGVQGEDSLAPIHCEGREELIASLAGLMENFK